jgi:ATP-dependent phosphoenolpyruvate carboxykinase
VLDNYITASTTRVKSDKNVPKDKFDQLKHKAVKKLDSVDSLEARANLNGVVVEFQGNSHHQYDFWKLNWNEAKSGSPIDARITSVFGLEDFEPSAFYCPETHESLFFNTEYYGQCKSWALGMAAAVLEQKRNTHSIHGACVDVDGKGVIIVAPTGTGKTTQAFKLMESPGGRIVGDDWVYIDHSEGQRLGHLVGKQPEKSLYMRTESQLNKEWLRKIFDENKCENVVTNKAKCEFTIGTTGCKLNNTKCVFNDGYQWCYYAFGNSRALVPREELFGKDKVTDEARIRLLVLLRRDDSSPPEVKLDADNAIRVLRKGEYMIRPGAGPKEMWGHMGYEPWYNPYLLHLDHARQEEFFRTMISKFNVSCLLLNTGVESVDGTYKRMMRALEAC